MQDSDSNAPTPALKYHAFISYRHADNKDDGRHWATWLHHALETYEVPSELVGKTNGRGEVIPPRIYPIFRDEEDLPADANLGGSITRALDQTRLLIVICSPRAVQSSYVADEIDYFKRIGRSDRIIALIIDGEPNASLDAAKQQDANLAGTECFPKPLQFEYDAEGPTTAIAEPIAADLRITDAGVTTQGWTNPESFRDALKANSQYTAVEIDERISRYVKQHKLMLLKIIAGIIGVPLGELTQRDKAYQIALERERAKKLRRWLMAVGMLAIVAIAAGGFALLKQQEALASQRQAQASERKAVQRFLAQMEAEANRLTHDAVQQLDANNSGDAIAKLLKALPEDINAPEWPISNTTKAALNRAVAMHRETMAFTGPNEAIKQIAVVANNNIALLGEQSLYVYTREGKLIAHKPFGTGLDVHFSADKTQLYAAGFHQREEPAPNEPSTTHYVSYFSAYIFDLNTGDTLSHITRKVETGYYNTIHNLGQSLFSDDGRLYAAQHWVDSASMVEIIDTSSGLVISAHPINGYIRLARFAANNRLVIKYDSQINEQAYRTHISLIQSDGTITSLLNAQHNTACKNGQLLTTEANIERYLKLALNQTKTHLMAALPDINAPYDAGCVIAWNLATGERSTPVHFSDKTDNSPTATQIRDMALHSSPLWLHRNNRGDNRPTKNLTAKHAAKQQVYFSDGDYHVSAEARDSDIYLRHLSDETISSPGGKVTAFYLDKPSQTLWYASLDGGIRAWRINDNSALYPTGLAEVDELHVGSAFIVATDTYARDQRRFQYAVLNPEDPSFSSVRSFDFSSPFNQVSSQLYGEHHLGVLLNYNDRSYGKTNASQRRLHLFSLTDGNEITSFQHQQNAYEFPPSNGTYTAYAKGSDVMLVKLSDGREQAVSLPQGHTPNSLQFINDTLVISASDAHADQPELRHMSIFTVDTKALNTPVKIYETQAQDLQVTASPHTSSLLLNFDYYDYQRPNELMALSASGKLDKINVEWDDSWGHSYLLTNNKHLLAIKDGAAIKSYDFNGNLVTTTYSDQDWFEGRLGANQNYLIDSDSFQPLQHHKLCTQLNITNDGSYFSDSPDGETLIAANYETTRIYDLNACTAIADLMFQPSSKLMGINNNNVWVAKDKTVMRKTIRRKFSDNYAAANVIQAWQLRQ